MKIISIIGIALIMTGIVLLGMTSTIGNNKIIIKEKNAFKGEIHTIYVKTGYFYIENGTITGKNSTNSEFFLHQGKYTVVVKQNGTFEVRRVGISNDVIFTTYPIVCGVATIVFDVFIKKYIKERNLGFTHTT